jgi:hypothetical protein
MRTTLKAKVDGDRNVGFSPWGEANMGSGMKAIFVEPFLVLASSLLWIIVLPFAALVYSGIAISERVAAH